MAQLRQQAIIHDLRSAPAPLRAIQRIQWFTIAWMAIEAGVSLFTAIRANSVALAAFGADSAIELLSAATVLWWFHTQRRQTEASVTKITAWLLIALAVYIVTSSLYALTLHRRAEKSYF